MKWILSIQIKKKMITAGNLKKIGIQVLTFLKPLTEALGIGCVTLVAASIGLIIGGLFISGLILGCLSMIIVIPLLCLIEYFVEDFPKEKGLPK